ncbi:MAG: YbhB/YbcL family Raf kinase inhibitor-like protein [Carboxydocellales bacterium]
MSEEKVFILKSSAFENGGIIPEKYTELNQVSPPLSWENAPAGTQSFALAVTDPDVPALLNFPRCFAHWLIYNIPASYNKLPEGASPAGDIPAGAKELNSDFVTAFHAPGFQAGYGAPWPPDAAHRYVFTLYALKSANLGIPGDADYVEFAKIILPQTITTATLIGCYGPAKKPLPGA